ncbi:MAG: hypothetical protein Q9169_005964 [Polycauliona sp. 2 TL-2023]
MSPDLQPNRQERTNEVPGTIREKDRLESDRLEDAKVEERGYSKLVLCAQYHTVLNNGMLDTDEMINHHLNLAPACPLVKDCGAQPKEKEQDQQQINEEAGLTYAELIRRRAGIEDKFAKLYIQEEEQLKTPRILKERLDPDVVVLQDNLPKGARVVEVSLVTSLVKLRGKHDGKQKEVEESEKHHESLTRGMNKLVEGTPGGVNTQLTELLKVPGLTKNKPMTLLKEQRGEEKESVEACGLENAKVAERTCSTPDLCTNYRGIYIDGKLNSDKIIRNHPDKTLDFPLAIEMLSHLQKRRRIHEEVTYAKLKLRHDNFERKLKGVYNSIQAANSHMDEIISIYESWLEASRELRRMDAQWRRGIRNAGGRNHPILEQAGTDLHDKAIRMTRILGNLRGRREVIAEANKQVRRIIEQLDELIPSSQEEQQPDDDDENLSKQSTKPTMKKKKPEGLIVKWTRLGKERQRLYEQLLELEKEYEEKYRKLARLDDMVLKQREQWEQHQVEIHALFLARQESAPVQRLLAVLHSIITWVL